MLGAWHQLGDQFRKCSSADLSKWGKLILFLKWIRGLH